MPLIKAKSQLVVWSLFVRFTHWFVALTVIINFFNATGFWHRAIGYACLTAVFLRIVDGLWISRWPSSKFYWPTFTNIKSHLAEIKSQHFTPHFDCNPPGHNPLGQYAVYIIWLLIFLLAFTGWLSRTDAYWGEDWPVEWHAFFANVLQGVVLLHVLAVVVMSKLQKKNLVKQMVVGKP